MAKARWKALVAKAVSACVAAIEVYNKPVMPHRDETFAMLAVNAWELLMKARLVKEGGGKIRAIQVLVPVNGPDGRPTGKTRVDTNRAGNPKTISFAEALHRVSQLPAKRLDAACVTNLWALVEIRDNAVHFVNEDPEMARRSHEAACACIRNFVAAAAEWFDEDLSPHRFMILPLCFDTATGPALAVPAKRSRQAANLMTYLDRAGEAHPVTAEGRYAAAVKLETRIVGTRNPDAVAVRLSGAPGLPEVRLTDDQIRERWPHDYAELKRQARARIHGLKFNNDFHTAMRKLKTDSRYVYRRLLDPSKPKSQSKEFYSQAAVDVLVKELEILFLL